MAIDVNFKFSHSYPILGASIEAATPGDVEDITTSGASQATTITAPNDDCMLVVEAWGSGSAWIEIGANPTAAVGTTHLITAPSTRYFAGLKTGDKIAIIDDS